jgi:FkbM family methyltransferase
MFLQGKPLRLAFAQILCRTLPPIFAQRLRHFVYPIETASKNNYLFTVSAQTGSLFSHRTSDFHAYPFSVHGYYEWRSWAIAIALCSPGENILEIGANIGTETVGFADIVGKNGSVYAVEPLPSNLTALQKAVLLNRHHNINVLPFVIGDECKKVKFVVPPFTTASGLGHILGANENAKAAASTIELECVTLDSLSDRIGQVRLVFIDAEGAEPMILAGGKNFLSKHRPTIVLEAHPKYLHRAGFSLSELRNRITALGYEIFDICRLGLTKPKLQSTAVSNWLCVHSTRIADISSANRYVRVCGLLPCIPGVNPMSRRLGSFRRVEKQDRC